MSIDKTKEQIAALVPDEGYFGDWIEAPYNDLPEFTDKGVAALKALADSHTELLGAAKDFVAAFYATENLEGDLGSLEDVIAKAEAQPVSEEGI